MFAPAVGGAVGGNDGFAVVSGAFGCFGMIRFVVGRGEGKLVGRGDIGLGLGFFVGFGVG